MPEKRFGPNSKGQKMISKIKINRIFGLVLAAWMLTNFPASAEAQMVSVDGNTLLGLCNANLKQERIGDWAMKVGTCLGFLTAIVNINLSGAAVGGRKACIPSNADMNQVVDVFKAYLRDHPERRHLLGANLAGEAFSSAFPCRS